MYSPPSIAHKHKSRTKNPRRRMRNAQAYISDDYCADKCNPAILKHSSQHCAKAFHQDRLSRCRWRRFKITVVIRRLRNCTPFIRPAAAKKHGLPNSGDLIRHRGVQRLRIKIAISMPLTPPRGCLHFYAIHPKTRLSTPSVQYCMFRNS